MHSQPRDRAVRIQWGVDEPPVRGPKARWGLPDVADAGVAIADSVGLAGLSLARVAERLQMTTTALYRYVDSKDVLVELMVDAAVGEPPELTGGSWTERCRSWVRHLRACYAKHPWLSDVQPTGAPRLPNPIAWIDVLVRGVAEVDVDALRLALLLEALVRAYSGIARGVAQSAPPEQWLVAALAARFPALAAAGGRDWSDADDELEFAVGVVLAGVVAAGVGAPGAQAP